MGTAAGPVHGNRNGTGIRRRSDGPLAAIIHASQLDGVVSRSQGRHDRVFQALQLVLHQGSSRGDLPAQGGGIHHRVNHGADRQEREREDKEGDEQFDHGESGFFLPFHCSFTRPVEPTVMFLVPSRLETVMVLVLAFPLELKVTDELVRVMPAKSELKSRFLATNPSLTLVT